MNKDFDLEQAIKALQSGQDLTGKDSFLTPLIKQITEAALKAELEQHLEGDEQPNRKNGSSKKTIKYSVGTFELDTPRDRSGTFEPQLVKKNQTKLTDEIDRKILSMFSFGMSYRDIRSHVEDMYGIEVSEATITGITDRLIPELKEWQQRPLDALYPFVWLDAIYYQIKEDGRYVSKAIYTILGLDVEGKKELVGLYLSESEGANYSLSVLTDLYNRGVEDILIACVDGLTGFPEAIATIYPDTEVQQCTIHQIRNSMKYAAFKHQKAFMADLKPVYRAVSKEAAEVKLDRLEAKWGQQYQIVIRSWRNKWANLSVYFKYPEYVRKAIYTTNAIEALHRQFRKLTKTKGGFPNENSLLKLLYASKKWTMPIQNWNMTLSQLAIHFEGRLDYVLDI
ncbi:IS256 family transposase [Vibrio alginolyticus]|uniref:IS256 family transposase n=1 Tax=Vibrio alginolyticus TaxID=663 RepID=UPI0025541335|nr:IS256 family transposase [Vibrio alginolyticus]MDL0445799.1 IS256 family transposase [Vibrio alginolyticus]